MTVSDLMVTEDGKAGAVAGAHMLDVYVQRYGTRIPVGDVPTSWHGVTTLAALLADLMLYAHVYGEDWHQAVEAADEMYVWDADPMGRVR